MVKDLVDTSLKFKMMEISLFTTRITMLYGLLVPIDDFNRDVTDSSHPHYLIFTNINLLNKSYSFLFLLYILVFLLFLFLNPRGVSRVEVVHYLATVSLLMTFLHIGVEKYLRIRIVLLHRI